MIAGCGSRGALLSLRVVGTAVEVRADELLAVVKRRGVEGKERVVVVVSCEEDRSRCRCDWNLD